MGKTIENLGGGKGDQNYGTPRYFYEYFNEYFGFTRDCCADEINHKHEKYWSKQDNALEQSWKDEILWCNPPFGQIADFAEKAYNELQKHGTTTVMITPNYSGTFYYQDYISKAQIWHITGRIRFQLPGRQELAGENPNYMIIVVFSPRRCRMGNMSGEVNLLNLQKIQDHVFAQGNLFEKEIIAEPVEKVDKTEEALKKLTSG